MTAEVRAESTGARAGQAAEAAEAGFATFRVLSEHDRKAVMLIIESKYRIKAAQDQLRDDAKAVAERLGMRPPQLNKIVRLAMLERERGNVLAHEKALIDVAEQVLGQ